MAYTVETINNCTKKLVFNFADVDLKDQIEKVLTEKRQTASLKGFRQGKAPMSMVRSLYEGQAQNDALYRFVSEEFYKALQDSEIQAIGYPTFGNTKYEGGNEVSFEATVETFPEFELGDYSKLSFSKDDNTVTDKEVEDLRNNYLNSKSEMTEISDDSVAIDNGHFVVFNFEGEKEDGTKPDNMKANEFLLEIGSGQFIPGFEEGMIGLKKGDKKTISVTFPADYHEEGLRGAPVKFHVDVLELKEKKLPEITDELVKEFGFDTVSDFEEKTQKRLETSKTREVKMKLQEDILKKLIEENTFDIPSTLLDSQKKSVREELGQNLKSQGFTDEMLKTYFDKWEEDVTQKAEFQVRSGLILDKLAKKYEVEATDADFKAKLEEMAEQSGMKADEVEKMYANNENVKNNIMYAIREEKTFDKLVSEVKVK